MLGEAQFMIDFQGMHFNAKKAFYINFQKHASMFRKKILRKINGGGHTLLYVLPKMVCATKNDDFTMEDR